MAAMREFDWSYELGMYVATAACLVVVVLLASGLIVLVRFLLRRNRQHGLDKP